MERFGCLCLAILAVGLLIPGWTALQGALLNDHLPQQALQEAGYTDIERVSKDIWFLEFKGGHEGDAGLYTFEATNPIGQRVRVKVYLSDWPWSSATIRTR